MIKMSVRGRLQKLLRFLTKDASVQDPTYLFLLVDAMNRMCAEREDVRLMFCKADGSKTLIFIKASQTYVRSPSSRNKAAMQAAWSRLDGCQKRAIARITVATGDDCRFRLRCEPKHPKPCRDFQHLPQRVLALRAFLVQGGRKREIEAAIERERERKRSRCSTAKV